MRNVFWQLRERRIAVEKSIIEDVGRKVIGKLVLDLYNPMFSSFFILRKSNNERF